MPDPDDLQYRGPLRDSALAHMHRRLRDWQIAPPPAAPLVLDFGLGDFEHTGLIELWICNELRAGYCGKYMFLHAGQQCPAHQHRVKHETFFGVRGTLRIAIDGRAQVFRPGQTVTVQAGKVHCFSAHDEDALVLELSMPCDVADNLFEDPRIAAWLKRSLHL